MRPRLNQGLTLLVALLLVVFGATLLATATVVEGECKTYRNHSGYLPDQYDYGVFIEHDPPIEIVSDQTERPWWHGAGNKWDEVKKCKIPQTTTTTTVVTTTTSLPPTTTTSVAETTTTTGPSTTTTTPEVSSSTTQPPAESSTTTVTSLPTTSTVPESTTTTLPPATSSTTIVTTTVETLPETGLGPAFPGLILLGLGSVALGATLVASLGTRHLDKRDT